MRCTNFLVLSAVIPVAMLPAQAAETVQKYDWTGFYVGGHVSLAHGHATATVWDPEITPRGNRFGGPLGGVQFGYNAVLPSDLLLGWEIDATFPNYISANATISSVPMAQNHVTEQLDYLTTARGRIGGVFGPWLVYGTGGVALMGSRFINEMPSGNDEKKLRARWGAAFGGGLEYAFDANWTARFEYLYASFARANVTFPSGVSFASTPDVGMFRFGLNRTFDDRSRFTKTDSQSSIDWQILGQTTYIQQGYPSFRSPYEGPNSLAGGAQTRNTVSATAFIGVRPWQAGELFYAPELAQGFGLSDTLGLGGFSNGEAQKAGFAYPHYNTSRLFFRQTFGLGDEQEKIEQDEIHLENKANVSRVSVVVGRAFLPDFIDNNSYADEPRTGFLNWSIWAAGAFDFPADQPGYSWGAFVELNQKDWAVRTGYLLMPKESNSNYFDQNVFNRGEYLLETELRYSLLSHPGKLRLIGRINFGNSGSYAETLANPALHLDITQTRRNRTKYGAVANVEQSLSDDFGLFSRPSWNNGKTEIMAFTDIDASASFGGVLKGTRWGLASPRRPASPVTLAQPPALN